MQGSKTSKAGNVDESGGGFKQIENSTKNLLKKSGRGYNVAIISKLNGGLNKKRVQRGNIVPIICKFNSSSHR